MVEVGCPSTYVWASFLKRKKEERKERREKAGKREGGREGGRRKKKKEKKKRKENKEKRKERGKKKKRLSLPEPTRHCLEGAWCGPGGRDKRAGSSLPGILKIPCFRLSKSEQTAPGKQVAGCTEVSKSGSRLHLPKRSLLIPAAHEKARRSSVTSNRSFN